MTLATVFFLLCFSFAHVFFPGHPTPILLAVGGMNQRSAWKFTGGIILSHGIVMALFLVFGHGILLALQSFWPGGRFWLTHLDIFLLSGLAVFLLYKALGEGHTHDENGRCQHDHKHEETGHPHFECRSAPSLNPTRPFWTGMAIGAVPCPDTLSYAVLGGTLTDHSSGIWAALLVFIGTGLSFATVTGLGQVLPRIISSPNTGRVICGVTALLCGLIVGYRIYHTWHDWFQ
jgi:ABC-type nickel/cobalt efflux system permease component RcnA